MQKSMKRWLSCGLVLELILTLLIPTQSVEAAVKKPKFNVTKKTMVVGKTTTLKISNKVKNAKYVWKTSKKSVATVSSKGVVKAVRKGSAVISCSIKVKNKTKYTLKCSITVKEPVRKTFFERNNVKAAENAGGESGCMLRQVNSDVLEHFEVEGWGLILDLEPEEQKEGYEGFAYIFTSYTDKSLDYQLTVFDRFTGRCLRSIQLTSEMGTTTTTEEVSVIGVDGKKYDCSVEFSQKITKDLSGQPYIEFMMKVIYPSEYDGIAFQFGSFSDEQKAIYNKIDFEKGYDLDDFPDLWENQYFLVSRYTLKIGLMDPYPYR